MYNEIIFLADEIETEKKDEYGNPVLELKSTQVFAKLTSIGMKEFYQAQTAGLKPEIKFIIPDYLDYAEQKLLLHEGVRYQILRTYRNESNELEITCYGGVRDAIT